jgi:hypothetical protein
MAAMTEGSLNFYLPLAIIGKLSSLPHHYRVVLKEPYYREEFCNLPAKMRSHSLMVLVDALL